jgi:ribulose-5-phosphate 4-epimerase/fuculose-1-phosphate aldolase
MAEQEGVIKFDLRFTPAPPLPRAQLATLNAWRTILHRLGLIGQDPERYGGVGFGNVSMRLEPGSARFIVSGSQTGALTILDERHYSVVSDFDVAANRLVAEGPVAPSSESLTHGMLYALDPGIRFVFHAHSPAIWRAAARLGLPATAAHAAYGTPAMAEEVRRLLAAAHASGVFVMSGHEDGVVSFGATAEEAGVRLIGLLARALTEPC